MGGLGWDHHHRFRRTGMLSLYSKHQWCKTKFFWYRCIQIDRAFNWTDHKQRQVRNYFRCSGIRVGGCRRVTRILACYDRSSSQVSPALRKNLQDKLVSNLQVSSFRNAKRPTLATPRHSNCVPNNEVARYYIDKPVLQASNTITMHAIICSWRKLPTLETFTTEGMDDPRTIH